MNLKDMILKRKGKWLVTKEDKTKWIIDLDDMMFDNYEWYKATGTLESELTDVSWFMKNSNMRKIKEEN